MMQLFSVDFLKRIPFQLNSNDVEMLTLKTNVHLALQQKDEAIDCCKRILKLNPKNSEAESLLEQLQNL